MRLLITFIALLLLQPLAVSAVRAAGAEKPPQSAINKRIDDLVNLAIKRGGIAGYSLVVIKDGKVLHQAGYGFADRAHAVPVTPDTVFGLASVTKTFTALALLSLVESGKLSLDDPLSKHLTGLPSSWKNLTLRQLASMTAGVPNDIPREKPWPEEMAIIQTKPLLFKPGSRYSYSNPSYRTLGTVIERVTGKPYLQYLNSTVLKPLDMKSTGSREDLEKTATVSQPFGVNQSTGRSVLLRYKPTEISFSSGMLFSNATDMSKYAQALLDHKLLNAGSYKTLFVSRPPLSTGAQSNWAFGWGVERKKAYGGRLVYGMNGGNPGVASTILLVPEEKLAIVGLSNVYAPTAYRIPRMVAQAVLGLKPNTGVEFSEAQELSF